MGLFAQTKDANHDRYQEALDFANNWLDHFDAGDADATFNLLAPIFQANLTREVWSRSVAESRAKLGKRLSRKLRRIVWYQDPANAPLPGLYAAVEFDSVFVNADRHFQYLMLHSQNGAPFRLMRREATEVFNKPAEAKGDV
jgi:hypothetical protein